MAHPRYAYAGFHLKLSLTRSGLARLSLTRGVTVVAVLAAAGLICGPTFAQPANRLAATGNPVTAGASSAPATPATSAASQADPLWRGPITIKPSRIATAVAAAPVADVVFGPPGTMGALGIPVMVLQAYHRAADRVNLAQPACKLPWWLLAGIGHTESGHAESGRLTADGTTRGRILGPRLNGGIAGDAVISDTDHGAYDGDTVYDRAVGPMQFIPATWQKWGADGNGDGKRDPNNIFDATLAAGDYLCADGRDLSTAAGLKAAVFSYNHSDPYYQTVLAWGTAYRDGASAVIDSTLPVVGDVTKVRPPISSRPVKNRPVAVTTTPSVKPSASHSPSAHPSPSASCSTSSASASGSTTSASPSGSTTSASPSGSGSQRAGQSSQAQTAQAQTAQPQTAQAQTAQTQTAQPQTAQTQTAQPQTGQPQSASGSASSSRTSGTPSSTPSSTATGCVR